MLCMCLLSITGQLQILQILPSVFRLFTHSCIKGKDSSERMEEGETMTFEDTSCFSGLVPEVYFSRPPGWLA